MNWIGYFPIAGRTPALVEEILKKLPLEITLQTDDEGIQITTKTEQVWNITNQEIGEYLILPAEDPNQIYKTKQTKKRLNVNEPSLTLLAPKKAASGRKLSLFDQMQYTGTPSQTSIDGKASSMDKSAPLSTQLPPRSGGSSKTQQSRTWESWFSDDRTSTPQSKHSFESPLLTFPFLVRIQEEKTKQITTLTRQGKIKRNKDWNFDSFIFRL